MKNYLLVSQCQGKAFKHTRRTASGFLARLGQDTWQGTLSTEALKIMVQELKRKASRFSCVAVYDVSGRTRQKVIHIGNRARYIESGEFAFSVHKSPDKLLPNPATQMRLLSKVCEMAGLLHDLGKGTKRFQDKLDYGVKYDKGLGDPVRHEVVSVLMGLPMLQWLETQSPDDLSKNPRLLGQWCDTTLPAILAQFRSSSQDPCAISSEIALALNTALAQDRWAKEHLVCTSTLWLVLAHHRMPEGLQGNKEPLFPGIKYDGRDPKLYFLKCRLTVDQIDDPEKTEDPFVKNYSLKDIGDNLSLYQGTPATPARQPWHDLEWLKKVISAFKRLRTLFGNAEPELPDNALTANSEWATAMALMGRTALVYADYMISHEKVGAGTTRAPGGVYANTTKNGDQGIYADTLTKHLIGVGDRAAVYFQDMFIKPEPLITSFPRLSLDDRNALLPGLNRSSSDDRYQWQDKARQVLSKHRSNEPFFGSVMGKTGAGKTRGNVMVMHAMKEDVRFTCAIGLRSLVSQTYQAYQEPFIGLTSDNLAILIGESLGSRLKVADEKLGSGNDLGEDSSSLLGDYVLEGQGIFEHPLSTLFDTSKQRSMLTQPVQVMTVDHISPGASLGRSSELKLLLHLMATDIILDEIDDYPVESQAALMRMAFISGVFGRSFVLSSATATPIIQKAFFDSWIEGHKQGRVIFQNQNRSESPKAVLVSHVQGSEALVVQSHEFDSKCRAFIEAVAQEARSKARHRVEVISLREKEPGSIAPPSLANLYTKKTLSLSQHEELVGSMLAFHQRFSVTDQGVRVSSGFVRFNNVKNAQHLAVFLNQMADPHTLVIPICYHAKMLSFEREQVEQLLLSLNCRKDTSSVSGEERITHHPVAKQAVIEALRKGKSDVIFVLCTTSIIEVGRDHDYDWAILEPSSTRSLVQSCGRVWRHRTKELPSEVANVGVLKANVLSICSADKRQPFVWVRHGIEDTRYGKGDKPVVSLTNPVPKYGWEALGHLGIDRGFLVESAGLSTEKTKAMNVAGIFWHKMINAGGRLVHAGLCLEIPEKVTDSIMGSMELANQHIHLVGTGDSSFSRQYPAGKQFSDLASARLCSHHGDSRRLREPNSTVSLEYDARLSGFDAQGNPKPTGWSMVNQLGLEMNQSVKLGSLSQGALWRPQCLEVFLENGMPPGRAAKLSIRSDEFRSLNSFRYIFGIGLIKDFW
ncbi:hypothetical protein IFT69_13145 [Pseudomonas putida]|nr:hypothetical protein [Pseudomonas putida]